MNPYSGIDFIQFLYVFVMRCGQFLMGKLSHNSLVSDEIQIIVLVGVGVIASIMGTLLVVRKTTMLANALSHTVLLGIVISYLIFFQSGLPHGLSIDIKTMLMSATVAAVITSFLTEFFHKAFQLRQDVSIGLVFTMLFALSITLVTIFSRNAHIGIEMVMGNVDALHLDDIKIVYSALGIIGIVVLAFFREIYMTTFDSTFSSSVGISSKFFHYLIVITTSMVIMCAFRCVGFVLVLALLVGPPLIARLIVHRLREIIYVSASLSIGFAICTVAISRHIFSTMKTPLSTSGIMITLILCTYIVASFLHRYISILAKVSSKHTISENREESTC
ncbi:MAG: metal ABC transporter permease [Chlamydiales bacterium]